MAALWQRVVEGEAATARGRPSGQGGNLPVRVLTDVSRRPCMRRTALTQALCRRVPTDTREGGRGPALHYTFGTMTGALYGALVEVAPALTMAGGVPFGLAVWLLADELALQALGLSQPPTRQTLATHTYAFASHCVYGLTTECTRRVVRRVL